MHRTATHVGRRHAAVPQQRRDSRGRPEAVPHPTTAERAARGRAARRTAPRSSHAELALPAGRDPLALLEEQAVSRLPDLVPIRYGRMTSSPFAFFRGAARVMAADLASTPTSGLRAQLCGDAHLSNFGLFASPERRLVFDINDFDETLPGPWEWDVKRLAASLVVAGSENGFSDRHCRSIALAAVGRYRQAMRGFAETGNLAVWYSHVDVDEVEAGFAGRFDASQRRRAETSLAKARTRDSMQALRKLTHRVDGQQRILADPPLVVPLTELLPGLERADMQEALHALLRRYRRSLQSDRRVLLEQYRLVDVARKVVGVGSVGTRCWIMLLSGRDDADPLFLQAKEAPASVLAEFLGPGEYANQGHRVVAGQRLMQATSDIFLGWERATGIDAEQRDFYVRQLRDWKWSALVETFVPEELRWYGALCGWTLARAHACSGDRVAIASYLGGGDRFDHAVTDFAEAYAEQNLRDHAALLRAVESGRVVAEPGV